MNPSDTPKGPLAGMRVLDLATMLVGPMAAQAMGDMGADVIKVEAPGGDLMRRIGPRNSPDMGSFYLGYNRNKRSIELDLKTAEGQRVFDALVRSADVVVHSIRADAASRLRCAACRHGWTSMARKSWPNWGWVRAHVRRRAEVTEVRRSPPGRTEPFL